MTDALFYVVFNKHNVLIGHFPPIFNKLSRIIWKSRLLAKKEDFAMLVFLGFTRLRLKKYLPFGK